MLQAAFKSSLNSPKRHAYFTPTFPVLSTSNLSNSAKELCQKTNSNCLPTRSLSDA